MLSNFTLRAHGLPLLLLFTLSLFFAGSITAQTARIENLTKIPGTNRSFPADDFFTLHRSDRSFNSKRIDIDFTSSSKFRIHNDGGATLVVYKLTTTSTKDFTISGINIPSGGLRIAPGDFAEAQVNFISTGGDDAKRLINEKLVMESNATNAGSLDVTFRGAYMRLVEGFSEIDAQQIMQAFGFSSRMGVDNNGKLQVRPSSAYPSEANVNSGREGDLILNSGIFTAADPNRPVNMIQMAAFHGPGAVPTEWREPRTGKIVSDMKYRHGETYHQTLLPRAEDGSDRPAGDYTSEVETPFEIMVEGYRSTGGNRANDLKDEILAVRMYKVRDRRGRLIPNEYIVIHDYVGNGCGVGNFNCDWNDNVSYITNVRPVELPSAGNLSDVTVEVGQTKTIETSGAFDRGYAGNQFSYTLSLDGGGNAPNWLSIDSKSGRITATAPVAAAGNTFALEVRATDLNGNRVASTFVLAVDGEATIPPAPDADDLWLEAECAEVGGGWSVIGNGSAAGDRYVSFDSGSSLDSPPGNTSFNRVRFSFRLERATAYNFFARVRAPNGDDDSFWVSINGGTWTKWYEGLQSGGFNWQRFPGGALSLPSGANTIDFVYREDGTGLDKILLSEKNKVPSGEGGRAAGCEINDEGIALEAECATIGTGWKVWATTLASQEEYVTTDGGERIELSGSVPTSEQLRFEVSVDRAGRYALYMRMHAENQASNSVWFRVDDGPWLKFWKTVGRNNLLTNGFEWREMADDGEQVRFDLSAGAHTIAIAKRETDVLVDKLYLSTSDRRPTGLGPVAVNCGASSQSIQRAMSSTVGEDDLSIFPNPSDGPVTAVMTNDYTGAVQLTLIDPLGCYLWQRSYEKVEQTLRIETELQHLPAGLYRLQMIAGDQRQLRTVMKH